MRSRVYVVRDGGIDSYQRPVEMLKAVRVMGFVG